MSKNKFKEKLAAGVSTILGLAAALLVYSNWYPESLLQKNETPVTLSQVQADLAADFAGSVPGADIPRLSGAADFAAMLYDVEYAAAEPVGLVPTDVYSLKSWVNPYRSYTVNGRTRSGKRKAEVLTSGPDLLGDYNPYYLLELPDHTYILAQISPADAAAIQKGKDILLPVGRKTGMTETARQHLTAVCEEYGASTDGVLYTFDNAWQKEHQFTAFLLRFGASAVVFFVLAVGLLLTGNKVFHVEESG